MKFQRHLLILKKTRRSRRVFAKWCKTAHLECVEVQKRFGSDTAENGPSRIWVTPESPPPRVKQLTMRTSCPSLSNRPVFTFSLMKLMNLLRTNLLVLEGNKHTVRNMKSKTNFLNVIIFGEWHAFFNKEFQRNSDSEFRSLLRKAKLHCSTAG